MRWKVGRRTGASLVMLGALVLAVGCGRSDAGAPASTVPDPATSGAAHPFTADPPPGFEQVTLGRGVWRQSWGDDSGGNDAPFTVLSDDGRSVEISANGYAGFEGGGDLLGVAYRFGGIDWEHVTVGGHDAAWSPETADGPGEVLVDWGDDVVLDVVGAGLSEDELLEIAAAAAPSEDRGTAPVVEEPPAPWRVVGSVDADVLGAATSSVTRQYLAPPGPESGYGVGWLAGDASLTAVSLDGDALDVEALIPRRYWNEQQVSEGRPITVADRPGVLLDLCYCPPLYSDESHVLSVLTHDAEGAAVVVTSSGASGVTEDQLVAVAASVRPIDPAEWDAAVEQSRMIAANGPGLHPDPDEVEIGRGRDGQVEWLLQTETTDVFGSPEVGVDRCLKLADYTAACSLARGGFAGDQFLVAMEGEVPPEVGTFVIVVTADPAGDSVQITTGSDTGTGTLFPVPGTNQRAAVVFVEDPGVALCDPTPDPPPPPGMALMRVDLVDADGAAVGCVGFF